MNGSLNEHVVSRIRAGVTRAELQNELTAVGWTEEEIGTAYKDALVAMGTPVPVHGAQHAITKRSSVVDVAVNFFSFILLGITATSLGTLLYQVINKFVADPLDNTQYYWYAQSVTSTIHYSIAALIIAYPLYYFTMNLWFKRFRENEGRAEAPFSKFLTYVVLLIAAVVVVGDLITIVYFLLQGELTLRFILKALTIFAISGTVFGFYYLERKKVQYHVDIPRSRFQAFGLFMTGLVTLAIILGFFAGGSPKTERMRSFDETRAGHLSSLESCINSYAYTYKALPASLDDLMGSSVYCGASYNDPETGSEYEYRVVADRVVKGQTIYGTFELCATFGLKSDVRGESYYYGGGTNWSVHEAGRSCDDVDVVLDTVQTFQQVPVNELNNI